MPDINAIGRLYAERQLVFETFDALKNWRVTNPESGGIDELFDRNELERFRQNWNGTTAYGKRMQDGIDLILSQGVNRAHNDRSWPLGFDYLSENDIVPYSQQIDREIEQLKNPDPLPWLH